MSIFDSIAAKIMPPETADQRAEARRRAEAMCQGPDDWLTLAIDHHRRIERLFEQARSGSDAAARRAASRELATVLTAHANAEESVLYPMLAEDHKGHAAMAYQEQAMTKIEMHKLEMLEPMSREWLDKLEHIQGAVQHHVYEEESEWFGEVREALRGHDEALHARRFREEFERYAGGGMEMERPLQMAAEMGDETMRQPSGPIDQQGMSGRQSENDGPLDY